MIELMTKRKVRHISGDKTDMIYVLEPHVSIDAY